MPQESRITIHMVSSLDGFIKSKSGDISWMQQADHYPPGSTLSDKQINDFLASIDCYVMGSHTYELAVKLGWPYGDTPVKVLSSRINESPRSTVQFYQGKLSALCLQLKKQYANIWMVGGAQMTKEFVRFLCA